MIETHGEQGQQDERVQVQRPHVFVVNQVPEILDVMRELLQDERYHVATATVASPQTFAQIVTLQPSLLIVDLAIGKRGGWNLLNELQGHSRTCDIPVVVVSTDPRLLDRAKDAHGHQNVRSYVVKPFDLEVILATIQELIGPA